MSDDREIKVTVCPPGQAYGAYDLQNWSKNRNAGRSSVSTRGQLRTLHKRLKPVTKAEKRRRRRAERPSYLETETGAKGSE